MVKKCNASGGRLSEACQVSLLPNTHSADGWTAATSLCLYQYMSCCSCYVHAMLKQQWSCKNGEVSHLGLQALDLKMFLLGGVSQGGSMVDVGSLSSMIDQV